MPSLESYIWYERYRPRALDEMILNDDYRQLFSKYIEAGEVPHLLFVGPPGSGKSTLARILIEHTNALALALNASSSDRGIDTVKGKVKQFASSQSLDNKLKIVFLDEADGLTRDAQEALRNTVEVYSSSCRFILTANNGDKIIPALKSRCTMFSFDSINKEQLLEDMRWMLGNEKVSAAPDELKALVDRYYPDVRTIINNLQAGSVDGTFNPLTAGVAMDINLLALGESLKRGRINNARKQWAGNSDFVFLYRWLFDTWVPVQFTDDDRMGAALVVAQYLYQDSTVLDREINFTACCLDLMKEGNIKADWK